MSKFTWTEEIDPEETKVRSDNAREGWLALLTTCEKLANSVVPLATASIANNIEKRELVNDFNKKSRENEELRAELNSLKSEIESLKNSLHKANSRNRQLEMQDKDK